MVLEYSKDVPELKSWPLPIGQLVANAAVLEMETLRWLVQLTERPAHLSDLANKGFSARVKIILRYVHVRGYDEQWRTRASSAWQEASTIIKLRDRMLQNPVLARYPSGSNKAAEVFVPDIRKSDGGTSSPKVTQESLTVAVNAIPPLVGQLEELRRVWTATRDGGPSFPRLGRVGRWLEGLFRWAKAELNKHPQPQADITHKSMQPSEAAMPVVPRVENLGEIREFTVVMRGPAAVVFRQGEVLPLDAFPTKLGKVGIRYGSRWFPLEGAGQIPGQLWIEITGIAPSLDEALEPFANAALASSAVIALSANAAVDEPDVELAFDSSVGEGAREFFQSIMPPERLGVIHSGRLLDMEATHALLKAIWESKDHERLLRASHQYNLSLRNWRHGHATLSLAHLWMAVEALSPVRIRAELRLRGLKTSRELAGALGIDLTASDSVVSRALEAAIRQNFILRGDAECYAQGKRASDGFEHGFLDLGKVFDLSAKVRVAMAKHVRSEIFALSGLGAVLHERLENGEFAEPIGHWPVAKYVRGTLFGSREQLACADNQYPVLKWSSKVTKCELNDEGGFCFQTSETWEAEVGTGTVFEARRVEVWRPG